MKKKTTRSTVILDSTHRKIIELKKFSGRTIQREVEYWIQQAHNSIFGKKSAIADNSK